MAIDPKDVQTYLEALDEAAQAINLARKLIPDPGLDHAIDRLRFLLLQGTRMLPTEAGA